MEALRVEAYSPDEIARKISAVSKKKTALDFFRLFVLAILAGAFIGFGAEFYTLVVHDSGLSYGLNSLVGGLVFSLGLILVVLAGAELFTGNTLIVMGYVEGYVTTRRLFRSWAIAYVGNLVGSLILVALMYYSYQWKANGALVGAKALLIANAKVNLGFWQAFVRGILCNILVCLAIWLCFGARSTVDKILAVIFPVTAFVASGFEHCVANMYFIPMGLLLKSQPTVVAAAESITGQTLAFAHLNVPGFLVKNLLPVTLGNILGGSLCVGIVYWSIYLREFSFRSLLRLGQVGFRLVFFVNPRELSPVEVFSNLKGFYGFLSKKKPGRRPVPRDLTTLVEEESEEEEEALD